MGGNKQVSQSVAYRDRFLRLRARNLKTDKARKHLSQGDPPPRAGSAMFCPSTCNPTPPAPPIQHEHATTGLALLTVSHCSDRSRPIKAPQGGRQTAWRDAEPMT